jgi:hypothetical protein
MTAEERLPHVVYSKTHPYSGVAYYCENFPDARARWLTVHSYRTPFLIRQCVAREIDPATALVDPSE